MVWFIDKGIGEELHTLCIYCQFRSHHAVWSFADVFWKVIFCVKFILIEIDSYQYGSSDVQCRELLYQFLSSCFHLSEVDTARLDEQVCRGLQLIICIFI